MGQCRYSVSDALAAYYAACLGGIIMEEKKKRRKKTDRQEWKPNALLLVLYKIWKAFYAGLKVSLGALATVLLIVIVCGFVFINILGEYLEDEVMAVASVNLEDLELDKTSFIYYLDGEGQIQILQQIYSTTNRQWVDYEDIPEELVQACVAIEDKRFFEHQGVDWITTAKACLSMFFGGSEFGGSTITQQFIKNYYGDDDVTVQRKVMEIFRAIAMEKTYDKEVILEWYLNTVYFGEGCYGIKTAAANYFGKELQDMNVAELASLIGITNNPSLYRPFRASLDYGGLNGAERNRVRQLTILEEMHIQDRLDDQQYQQAVTYQLVFKQGIDEEDRWAKCGNADCGYQGAVRTLLSQESEVGNTLYFCPQCQQQIVVTTDASQTVYSWYVDEVIDQVARALAEEEGVEYTEATRDNYRDKLKRGGYHIYTPYNAEVQAAIDKVYTDLSQIPTVQSGQQLQSGIVVIDNRTGDIAGMAGGVGQKDVFDANNRATDSKLQIGSSMKPLAVYGPAFELGIITPATVLPDMPITFNNETPFPKNDNKQYNYSRTVWRGIVSSINTISVNTLELLGTQNSYDFAKYKFGLSTLTDYYVTSSGSILSDIGYSPLGMGALTLGVTVRDVTCAYATFANEGVYREGRVWTKIYDSYGNLVLENKQDSRKILGEKALNYLNYCLDSAVASGTGTSADLYKELGIDVAGKTGSTQSNKDRYFAGFTGYYTAAVWCGFDQPEEIILTNVYTNPACRLWKAVMVQLHQDLETIPLYDDSEMVSVTVCLDSGKLATEACNCDVRELKRTDTVLVYKEDAPTQFCDKHIMVNYCTAGECGANEWCLKFASVGAIRLEDVSLVKMTQSKIDEINAVKNKGLVYYYALNKYIYLVDSYGKPIPFHGLSDNMNIGVDFPYLVCTVHTQQAWEQFVAENPWVENGGKPPVEPEPDHGGDSDGGEKPDDQMPDNGGNTTQPPEGMDPDNGTAEPTVGTEPNDGNTEPTTGTQPGERG